MNDNMDLIRRHLPRRNEQKSILATAPTQQELDALFAERITPESDLPPMQPLFRMFDTPCFYRGELVADCGKAKSGKTTFLSVLMASAVSQAPILSLARAGEVPLKVVWIDTEQSQQSTQELQKERIAPLIRGHDAQDQQAPPALNDHLYAFNLRGLGYEARRRMVEVAIRSVKPDLAIIDGIKDLMTDINDAVQATLIMEQLMALAKDLNCCIVCVLHLNKSEADRNMRGSIGTELTNKAFEVFQCEMIEESETFKVSQTYSRKQKLRQRLYYRLDEQHRPTLIADYVEQPRDALGRFMSTKPKNENLATLFTEAMEGRVQRPFNELMAVAFKKFEFPDPKTYYAAIDEAIRQGIIRKTTHPERNETWIELVSQHPSLFLGEQAADTDLPF